MQRVVLDTNVFISAFASPFGIPGQIYEAWTTHDKFDLVISEYILNEFGRVAVNLGLDSEVVLQAVQRFYNFAEIIEPMMVVVDGIDDNDLPILGTAVAGIADAVITGDRALLALKKYRGIRIISPREFFEGLGGV